jgi:hypothetical protein
MPLYLFLTSYVFQMPSRWIRVQVALEELVEGVDTSAQSGLHALLTGRCGVRMR